MNLSTEMVSAIVQVIVLSLIPFIFFLFRKDKSVTFPQYLGLYNPPKRAVIFGLITSLLFLLIGIGLFFIDDDARRSLLTANSMPRKLQATGISGTSIAVLLIVALVKTSLAEEIFFRGFIAKRLIAGFDFSTGNLIQSILFGLIHLVLFAFLTDMKVLPLILIFILTTLVAWTIGYINEKKANGSIVPGWMAHGLGNAMAYYILAFVI